MALIRCIKCYEPISEHANQCPHCGYLYSEETKKFLTGFYAAKYEYDLAIEIVKEIGEMSKKFNPFFSTELASKELDYGIQEILYMLATYKGVIDDNKKYFIKQIVEHGDIFQDKIVDISIVGGGNIDWEVIPQLPKNTQDSIAQLMNKYVSSSVYTFLICAALAEKNECKQNNKKSDKTLLYQIEEKMIHIGIDFFCSIGEEANRLIVIVVAMVDMVFGFARREVESKSLDELLKM